MFHKHRKTQVLLVELTTCWESWVFKTQPEFWKLLGGKSQFRLISLRHLANIGTLCSAIDGSVTYIPPGYEDDVLFHLQFLLYLLPDSLYLSH